MASNSANWVPLPAFHNLPALLVRPVFTSQSYKVHVTDFANLWVEDLDRKGIGKRSLNEDTSIDPTEGPDQMLMLLNKIQAAFDPSAPDHNQTSIAIKSMPEGDDMLLALTITCRLPDGLKPLVWTFQMVKCPTAAIASELVLPVMNNLQARTQEVDELIEQLRVKDAIIDRLVDKLDHAGLGLENIWNVLSGKRNPSRAYAEEKINGLAPFREATWRNAALPSTDTVNGIISLAKDASSTPAGSEDLEKPAHNDLEWWQRCTTPVSSVPRTIPSSIGNKADVPLEESRHAADSDTDGDDFQVQATPPHLASTQTRRTEADPDETTDDDGDAIPDSHPIVSRPAKSELGVIGAKRKTADSPPVTQSPRRASVDTDATASDSEEEPVKSPPRKHKIGGIGRIGKKSEPEAESSKAKSPIHSSNTMDVDDETASESDGHQPSKSRSPVPPPAEPLPKRKIGTIGRIGGKARQASVQPERKSSTPEAESARPAGRKIGAIGKRQIDKTPQPEAASKSPDESEDDEQRAERKRAELARELERKANAKPAKKKRKF